MAVLAAAIPATVSRATPTISAESQDASTRLMPRRRMRSGHPADHSGADPGLFPLTRHLQLRQLQLVAYQRRNLRAGRSVY
jgi:hypothetical protein